MYLIHHAAICSLECRRFDDPSRLGRRGVPAVERVAALPDEDVHVSPLLFSDVPGPALRATKRSLPSSEIDQKPQMSKHILISRTV
jgi:hypothetical protein